MYAGTTIGRHSGSLTGAHQRLDRLARRHLRALIKQDDIFPSQKEILHFEGNNGPDGVKRKSPSVDEPWHFIDPAKDHDVSLIEVINDHLQNLADALREGNRERAAFEAAWSAHAIVDGLTPAHHYPLADKIEELFGIPHYERTSVKQKNLIKGSTRIDTFVKNWEYWGGGGIFSTHALFELGVATAMIGRQYKSIVTKDDIKALKERGYEALFRDSLAEIVSLDVYDLFQKTGWNLKVARLVHKKLIPEILRAVTLGWYAALLRSGEQK
ncbi:hypothetical protein CMN23_01655 [Candidatus Saccharibacteria bacterium]|nr:hypothetical protein [Candidatus Saccharibacteria bacterium]